MDGSGLIGTVIAFVVGVVIICGGPVFYLYLQARALWLWQGWWRVLALPPLVLMAGAVALMVEGFREGSNLAPIAVVFGAPMALAWLGIVNAIRKRARP